MCKEVVNNPEHDTSKGVYQHYPMNYGRRGIGGKATTSGG